MTLPLGATAPDFVLPGWCNDEATEVKLSQHRGRPLVLVFYRGDERLLAARRLRDYSAQADLLDEHGAQLWFVSPQDVHSHRWFSRDHAIRLPLLADTGSVVASMYDLADTPRGQRAVLVLDRAGVLRWQSVARGLTGFPRFSTVLREVARVDPAPSRPRHSTPRHSNGGQ